MSKTKLGSALAGIGLFLRLAGIGSEEISQILDAVSAVLMGGGATLFGFGHRDAISKNGKGE